MKRSLRCVTCAQDTEHSDVSSLLSMGKQKAHVVFECTVCRQTQSIDMTKDEYLGRPAPAATTATHFYCEHCCGNKDHEVTAVVRGKRHATVVLHCQSCNAETRRHPKLDEIPSQILQMEEALRQAAAYRAQRL